MPRGFLVALVAVVATLGGCGTPSVHPLYSPDKAIEEPGLIGAWRPAGQKGNGTVYEVSRQGEAYRLEIRQPGQTPARVPAIEARLVELGKFRFADFTVPASERESIGKAWGPLLMPTHLVARYALDGDRLSVWFLDRDALGAALREGAVRLAHTRPSTDLLLITAETPELQKFFEEHAEDRALFILIQLERVRP